MNAAMTKTDEAGDEPGLPDHGDWADAAGMDEGTDDEPHLSVGPDPSPAEIGLSCPSVTAAAVTDTQLALWIEAIVDHDERALAALYDATFNRVFGLAQRIVRNAAMAEEVVEDAYFQVWRQAVRFDASRGKPMTWLLAMVRSRAIDALRREARFQHELVDDDASLDIASAETAVDDLLDIARHRADLHQALMLIGAQPRQLVSMAFFRGLSHEEIAEQTRLPLGTVKSQIRRALLSLRQILRPGAAPVLAS